MSETMPISDANHRIELATMGLSEALTVRFVLNVGAVGRQGHSTCRMLTFVCCR